MSDECKLWTRMTKRMWVNSWLGEWRKRVIWWVKASYHHLKFLMKISRVFFAVNDTDASVKGQGFRPDVADLVTCLLFQHWMSVGWRWRSLPGPSTWTLTLWRWTSTPMLSTPVRILWLPPFANINQANWHHVCPCQYRGIPLSRQIIMIIIINQAKVVLKEGCFWWGVHLQGAW